MVQLITVSSSCSTLCQFNFNSIQFWQRSLPLHLQTHPPIWVRSKSITFTKITSVFFLEMARTECSTSTFCSSCCCCCDQPNWKSLQVVTGPWEGRDKQAYSILLRLTKQLSLSSFQSEYTISTSEIFSFNSFHEIYVCILHWLDKFATWTLLSTMASPWTLQASMKSLRRRHRRLEWHHGWLWWPRCQYQCRQNWISNFVILTISTNSLFKKSINIPPQSESHFSRLRVLTQK